MANANEYTITLGRDEEVVIRKGGAKVAFHADGTIEVFSDSAVKTHPANKDEKAPLEIGDVLEDGTVYGGVSPTTGQPMYVAPADAPLAMSFNEAAQYASQQGFRVPDMAEFAVLAANKDRGALKDTFNATGNSLYWTATPSRVDGYAITGDVKEGRGPGAEKKYPFLVRCIR